MAGQEVNETSCLVHAWIPLFSKKRQLTKGGFLFFLYTEWWEGTRACSYKSKMRSHVYLGCKAIRINPLGIESDGFRNTHNLNKAKTKWTQWCSHVLPSICEWQSTPWYVHFTQLLDPKAILTMNFTFPVAWKAPPSDSCENTHITESKGQKENISNVSVALRIVYSCGQHHGG